MYLDEFGDDVRNISTEVHEILVWNLELCCLLFSVSCWCGSMLFYEDSELYQLVIYPEYVQSIHCRWPLIVHTTCSTQHYLNINIIDAATCYHSSYACSSSVGFLVLIGPSSGSKVLTKSFQYHCRISQKTHIKHSFIILSFIAWENGKYFKFYIFKF